MREVIVLGYHAVSPRWDADLSITPAALDRQVGHLVRHGWRPTTFTDAVLGRGTGRWLAVTFDDAFASVRTHAEPILGRHRAVATVFAPAAFMTGRAELDWPGVDHWKHTEHAAEMAAMDWEDLRALQGSGWEIGSHTRTHPHLTRLDDVALSRELADSRAECEQELRGGCRSIAYPYGDVDDRVAAAAAAAGYQTGAKLSTDLRHEGPLRYPRIGIYRPDSWSRFRLKVARPARALRARGAASSRS